MMNKSHLKAKRSSYSTRQIDNKPPRPKVLIVCEGEKTERLYFESFHVSSLVIGEGKCTLSLVDATLKHMEEKKYDEVWCVFDKDDFPIDQFENAIHKAEANNIKVAYSNQCFELWYVLHFEYLQSSISRKDYIQKLSGHLKTPYKKNSTNLYFLLKSRQDQAIRNAESLLSNCDIKKPGRQDPSTSVHLLVIRLNEIAKPLYNK